MKAKGGNWTYDELFKYLKSPQSYVPGTKMSFAGLPREQDRINLIAYLRTNADSPAAIPAPAPKTAAPAARRRRLPAGAAPPRAADAAQACRPARQSPQRRCRGRRTAAAPKK